MKILLTILLLAAACTAANAQKNNKPFFPDSTGINTLRVFPERKISLPQNILRLNNPAIYHSDVPGTLLANGNTLVLLPGQMPCIKPDMKQFNMPNAGNKDMLKLRAFWESATGEKPLTLQPEFLAQMKKQVQQDIAAGRYMH
ncbi:MAG TPA: hypothetical protein PKC69_08515 [Chitinophagaceae bacterium]|nr:hypothetical protein [Chitinophagaceae bacterium]